MAKKHHIFTITAILFLLHSCFFVNQIAAVELVSAGSTWKYFSGVDQGTAWREPSFDDAAWAQGPAQLGFGESDEATVLTAGVGGVNYPTYYFRKSFNTTETFSNIQLRIKRDDGVVIYLNGVEIYRNNMPTGTINYSTLASGAASDDGQNWLYSNLLSSSNLLVGANVLAVEIHQNSNTSSDLSFDCTLYADEPVAAIRGAYLQMGMSNSMTIRWNTNLPTTSTVNYGDSPTNLSQTTSNTSLTTEHSVTLTGLSPETKYYYNIGNGTTIFQGDESYFFVTAPLIGTPKLTRVWVTGDCGTGYNTQVNVRNAYETYRASDYTDLWLILGDNAYVDGHDGQYQTNFFQPYMGGNVMRQTALFPTPGNHDYYNTSNLNNTTMPYFQNFTLPTTGQIGGVASNTEQYYSFNYANIHFVSLNSYGTIGSKKLYDTTSTQVTWLKQDLAANTQKWTVLYWHHPPYTMGSHNSDTEADLVAIRNNLIRILDRYKVDLVLCGHSHTYERSKLMKGNYGMETTFNAAAHNASQSSGLYDGTADSCPYIKSTNSIENEGIVYVVAGTAGKYGGAQTSWPHNAMYFSNNNTGGSMAIDVEDNRLDVKYISQTGTILDKFTMMKNVNQTTTINACPGDNIDMAASWLGDYNWTTGDATQTTSIIAPANSTSYTVSDTYQCITDTYNIVVTPAVQITGTNDVCSTGALTYSVPNQGANATYNWIVTGGVIISGQGTESIQVIWNETESNGSVNVQVN